MKSKSLLKLIVFNFFILIFCSNAFALRLGDSKTNSFVNQNLDAEIEIKDLGSTAAGSIRASLASEAYFTKFDLEYESYYKQIRFIVRQEESGKTYIHLTTAKVIREPLISIVVTLRWPSGNISKEYDLFLGLKPDMLPDSYANTKTTTITATKINIEKKSKLYRPDLNYDVEDFKVINQYGPIKPGESISMIAQRLRPDDTYGIQKISKLLHQLNKNSFVNGKINNLNIGAILKVPDLKEANLRKDSFSYLDQGSNNQAPQSYKHTENTPQTSTAKLKLVSDNEESELVNKSSKMFISGNKVNTTALNKSLDKTESLNAENNLLREQFDLLMQRMEEVIQQNDRLKQQVTLAAKEDPSTESTSTTPLSTTTTTDNNSIINVEKVIPDANPSTVTDMLPDIEVDDIKSDNSVSKALKDSNLDSNAKNSSAKKLDSVEKNTAKTSPETNTSSKVSEIKEVVTVADKTELNKEVNSNDGFNLIYVLIIIGSGLVLSILGFFGYKKYKTKNNKITGEFDLDSAWNTKEDSANNKEDNTTNKNTSSNESSDKFDEEIDFDLDLSDDSDIDKKSTHTIIEDEYIEETSEDDEGASFGLSLDDDIESTDDISINIKSPDADTHTNNSPSKPAINFNDILGSSNNKPSKSNVDIISQSSVYFAYGKFDLAEKVLIDGISAEPDQQAYKLKLFECYSKMDDEAKFLALFEQIKSTDKVDSDFIQKVGSMFSSKWNKEL